MKTTMIYSGNTKEIHAITTAVTIWSLAFWLAYLDVWAQSNDVRGPIPISANSPDGWMIGVCFDKPLSEESATNLANYSISEPGYAVVSAALRPDLQSVTLRLNSHYVVPFRLPQLSVTNILGLDGLSTPWTIYISLNDFRATDVGTLGTDPKDPGSFFTCLHNEFEIVSSGAGWEGTNDGFYFVHQPFNSQWDLIYGWRVSSLEAANKDSTVGLMVREDLTPSSRFLSVCVTPIGASARDGSGHGSALVKVLYRSQIGGPTTEISSTPSIKEIGLTNLWLYFSRWETVNIDLGWEKRVRVSWIKRVGAMFESQVLADVSFTVPLTDTWQVGFAAASKNNDAGFTSRSVSSILYSYYDPAPPMLQITRAGAGLTLSWTEYDRPSWRLLFQPKLDRLASWNRVTNAVVRVPGPFYTTNSVSLHLDGEGGFFSLLKEGL